MTAPAESSVSGRRRRLPPFLAATALLVSAAVVMPLVFLAVYAVQVGWAEIHQIVFRSLTATLVLDTCLLYTSDAADE